MYVFVYNKLARQLIFGTECAVFVRRVLKIIV